MRSDRSFLAIYRAAAASADPGSEHMSAAALRTVGLVELCLRFLDEHLPKERTDAVPAILLGYPSVLDTLAAPEAARRRLSALRHLCSRFSSVAAWLDAIRRHAGAPQTIRCHDVVGNRVLRRRMASAIILRVLDESLDAEVPWVTRKVQPAEPGEHHVRTNHGDTVLSYMVPLLRAAVPAPPRHRRTQRVINPPVVLAKRDMIRVAGEVDRTEAGRNWPSSLEPLRLTGRLGKVEVYDPSRRLWRDDSLVLDGATHLVGMLSSGKSSLVWGILFALTKGGGSRRVAVLATDTIQAAAMVARLQGHGVTATVLSSPYNREGHLNVSVRRLHADSAVRFVVHLTTQCQEFMDGG